VQSDAARTPRRRGYDPLGRCRLGRSPYRASPSMPAVSP